jgi:hypothetical protein
MRLAEHVSLSRGRGDVCRVLVENLKERYHWGDRFVDGKIILRWIVTKWDVEV